MTHADTTELYPEIPAPPPTLKQSRLTWIAILAAVVALALAGYSIVRLDQIADIEERRANRATATAEQLCQQVRQLGAVCAVDPARLPRGERGIQGVQGVQGAQGERGLQGIQGIQGERGLQGGQGIQGVQGERGLPGPACPNGWHEGPALAKDEKGRWTPIITCIHD